MIAAKPRPGCNCPHCRGECDPQDCQTCRVDEMERERQEDIAKGVLSGPRCRRRCDACGAFGAPDGDCNNCGGAATICTIHDTYHRDWEADDNLREEDEILDVEDDDDLWEE